ncbi:MAG: leucine-rich repeat protein [Treponema sp.]
MKCSSLVSATILSSSVKDLTACFRLCTSLTTVPIIPENVESMANCFLDCSNITQVSPIPKTVKRFYSCFENCEKLTSVILKCKYVDNNFDKAFKGCTSLENAGIKVQENDLKNYKDNAKKMGTTAEKFAKE